MPAWTYSTFAKTWRRLEEKASLLYLGFVGFEYVLLGLSGVTRFALAIAGLAAYYLVIVPQALVDSAVSCTSGWARCDSRTVAIVMEPQDAHRVIYSLSLAAVFLGALSIAGVVAMWRRRPIGYLIGLGFVILALATALYNLVSLSLFPKMFWRFGDRSWLPILSALWACLYAAFYVIASKDFWRSRLMAPGAKSEN